MDGTTADILNETNIRHVDTRAKELFANKNKTPNINKFIIIMVLYTAMFRSIIMITNLILTTFDTTDCNNISLRLGNMTQHR